MSIVKEMIPSTKGKVAAAIHYPGTSTKKLAILCPGYLDSKDYAHLVSLAEALCEKEYVVVRFDPTGTWESEGDISEYTTSQYLEDIKCVIEYMVSQENYTTILIGGHSRGGQVSILYAARDERVSCVLGIMPSQGPISGRRREEWERAGISISSRDSPTDSEKKVEFRVPFSHVLDHDRYDALSDIKKITVPVVLLAGELDTIVADVKKLFDSANEPKEFSILKGTGHGYWHDEEGLRLVNDEILRLLSALRE